MGTEKFDQRIIYILFVPRTYVASLYHKNLMVNTQSFGVFHTSESRLRTLGCIYIIMPTIRIVFS